MHNARVHCCGAVLVASQMNPADNAFLVVSVRCVGLNRGWGGLNQLAWGYR